MGGVLIFVVIITMSYTKRFKDDFDKEAVQKVALAVGLIFALSLLLAFLRK